jgi:hypothetical protein
VPDNAEGPFFITTLIDFDTCRQIAPATPVNTWTE